MHALRFILAISVFACELCSFALRDCACAPVASACLARCECVTTHGAGRPSRRQNLQPVTENDSRLVAASQGEADAAPCDCSAKPDVYSLLEKSSGLPSQWAALPWTRMLATRSADEDHHRFTRSFRMASFTNDDLCARLCRMTL